MGKKKKSEDKRGRALEKAAQKADKKQKSKKGDGEEDFDAILEEIRKLDLKRTAVTETKCPPPGPRCFGSLVAHPEKPELLLFGGEYLDGKSIRCYNDLFIYHIKQNEWAKWQIPNPPPPRSAHQAVCVPQGGGQMWVFGGEFTAANNESFHHFKDLWMLDLANTKWENIKAPGGPSSRSGHRMVAINRHLVVFGGFHESTRDFLYFNDVYVFSLQSYAWHRVNAAGGPSPRSAPSLSTTPQGHLLVFGGYSRLKMKRDGVEKAVVHSDAWTLVPLEMPASSTTDSAKALAATSSGKKSAAKKSEPAPRWKWAKVNTAGRGPTPRSGATTVQLSDQRAVLFGGAEDEDEEEKLKSRFLADIYQLATDGKPPRWFEVNVEELSRHDGAKPRRRRKKKMAAASVAATGVEDGDKAAADNDECEGGEESEYETESEDEEAREEAAAVAIDGTAESAEDRPDPSTSAEADGDATPPASASDVTVHAGDVFTCVVKSVNPASSEKQAQSKSSAGAAANADEDAASPAQGPTPRISASLAAKGGTLFVYGGMYEKGDRQVYFDDMYSLDLLRRSGGGGWKRLVPLRPEAQKWLEEEEEDDDEDEEDEDDGAEDDDDDEDDEPEDQGKASSAAARGSDEEDDDEEAASGSEDAPLPLVNPGENMAEFYIRTKESWMDKARGSCGADPKHNEKGAEEQEQAVKALAFQLAKAAYKSAA